MQPQSPTAKVSSAFELKGSMFTLAVLHLLNSDMNVFLADLRRHAQKTPNLFKNMPVVIDLQRINREDKDLDFLSLQHHLKQHGLIPVGVRHGSEKLNLAAEIAGLPLLSGQSNTPANAKSKPKAAIEKKALPSNTMVVTAPVRSGQQIYAKDANLIIIAPVSHGAEILADGHIHVYGILRGRALAGIKGDDTTRIFCQQLDAELVSIAGFYKLHDDLPSISAAMTQVYLEGDKIIIEGL